MGMQEAMLPTRSALAGNHDVGIGNAQSTVRKRTCRSRFTNAVTSSAGFNTLLLAA